MTFRADFFSNSHHEKSKYYQKKCLTKSNDIFFITKIDFNKCYHKRNKLIE